MFWLKRKLALFIHEAGALKFGKFTLTSGAKSPYYLDLRVVPSHPAAFDFVTDVYKQMILRKFGTNIVLVGVPSAGVPFAALTAFKLGVPMAFVRKKAKEHGAKKLVEGVIGDKRLVVVEDLISTGKSNLETIGLLRGEGFEASDVVLLVDRLQGGVQNCADKGVRVHAASTVLELVEVLKCEGKIGGEDYATVLAYVEKYQN